MSESHEEKAGIVMTANSPTPSQTLTGRCMCEAASYKISAPPVAVGLCHCNRCRPQSGSAFSTVMFVQRDAIEMSGETAVFEDVGSSGLRVLRRYCPRCGSPLTTESDLTSLANYSIHGSYRRGESGRLGDWASVPTLHRRQERRA